MEPPPDRILPRGIGAALRRRLSEEAVIVIGGPRTAGKSTVLRRLAASVGSRVLDLDDLAVREAVASDPAFFVNAPSPVLVDEFQHVPELLDAIKAELNREWRPGRFVLTGSTRYLTLPTAAQSLTGRVHLMELWPFAEVEIEESRGDFLSILTTEPERLLKRGAAPTDRTDAVRRCLTGGFPLALQRPDAAGRRRWFDDFLRLVIERDVLEISKVRQRELLPRLLRRLASQTGQILNVSRAAREVSEGFNATRAEEYLRLLEAVYLLYRLPAWGRTLRARVNALPKLHLTDTGLGGALLGLTEERIEARDPAAWTELGHLLETFVVDEVLKLASWRDEPLRFGHFRTHDGDEVDLVVERPDGKIAGIEVKAASRHTARDLSGLRLLRRRLGDLFLGGVILSFTPHPHTAEDGILALPIHALWR